MLIALGGEDRERLLERRLALRAEVLKDSNPAFHHIKLDGTEIDASRLRAEFMSFPMLPGRRLIEVDTAEKMGLESADILDLSAQEQDDVVLLLFSKWDGRKKLEKSLIKAKIAEVFGKPKPAEMRQMISTRARDKGLRLDGEAIEMVAQIVDLDVGRLERLLERLSLNGVQEIDVALLEEIFPGQAAFDLFAFARIAATGDLKRSLELCRRLEQERADPQAVLNILLWQLRLLLSVKAEMYTGETLQAAMKKNGLFGNRAQAIQGPLQRFSYDAHRKRLARMSRADRPIKMKIGEPWAWLESYLMDICPF